MFLYVLVCFYRYSIDGGRTLWYNPQLPVGWSLSGPPWSAPGGPVKIPVKTSPRSGGAFLFPTRQTPTSAAQCHLAFPATQKGCPAVRRAPRARPAPWRGIVARMRRVAGLLLQACRTELPLFDASRCNSLIFLVAICCIVRNSSDKKKGPRRGLSHCFILVRPVGFEPTTRGLRDCVHPF